MSLIEKWVELADIDFFPVGSAEEAGLSSLTSHRSSPSGDPFLTAVLEDLYINIHDRIIDIGCGKGSAMHYMHAFPFSIIFGIDKSEMVVRIARNNFKILKEERCHVAVYDATEFSNYQHFNYFYLYNPFPCQIVKQVLPQMKVNNATLIYNNPVCHDLVLLNGWKKLKEYPDKWGNGIFVYRRS